MFKAVKMDLIESCEMNDQLSFLKGFIMTDM